MCPNIANEHGIDDELKHYFWYQNFQHEPYNTAMPIYCGFDQIITMLQSLKVARVSHVFWVYHALPKKFQVHDFADNLYTALLLTMNEICVNIISRA